MSFAALTTAQQAPVVHDLPIHPELGAHGADRQAPRSSALQWRVARTVRLGSPKRQKAARHNEAAVLESCLRASPDFSLCSKH